MVKEGFHRLLGGRGETNGSTTAMCAPWDWVRPALYYTGARRSRLTRRVRRLLAAALGVAAEFGRDLSLVLSTDSHSLGLPGVAMAGHPSG
jgi:hypothetical protein